MIKGQFPNSTEVQRIQTLQNYNLLYNNEQYRVFGLHDIIKKQIANGLEKLYLAHSIPSKISDFYGDFVQGDASRMLIDTDGEDEQEKTKLAEIIKTNDLVERIYDIGVNQSQYGYDVLLGYVQDGKFKIQIVDKDQYFPQKDGSVIFATYLTDNNDETKKRKVLFTEQYRVENKKVTIERKLWEIDLQGRASQELALSAMGITALPLETIENLTRLPIVQIDNGRKNKYGFGKSDYADIMPNLQEINERSTHVVTQLLKNLDGILEIPKSSNNRDESSGKIKSIDLIELTDDKTPRTKWVTFDTTALDTVFRHLDRQLQFISWQTGVPMFELLSSGMPERVESMKIKLFSAIRKTDTKRAKVQAGIHEIVSIGFEMLGLELKSKVYIDFSSVIPTDMVADATVEQIKVSAGLSSKTSAMKRLENYSDQEAEAEMELIQSEGIKTGAINPNNAPQL